MTLTTYDNAAPLDGWAPVAKHCGLLCFDVACGICGEYVTPANIELGSE